MRIIRKAFRCHGRIFPTFLLRFILFTTHTWCWLRTWFTFIWGVMMWSIVFVNLWLNYCIWGFCCDWSSVRFNNNSFVLRLQIVVDWSVWYLLIQKFRTNPCWVASYCNNLAVFNFNILWILPLFIRSAGEITNVYLSEVFCLWLRFSKVILLAFSNGHSLIFLIKWMVLNCHQINFVVATHLAHYILSCIIVKSKRT